MLEFSKKFLSLARSLSLFRLEFSEKWRKNKPVLVQSDLRNICDVLFLIFEKYFVNALSFFNHDIQVNNILPVSPDEGSGGLRGRLECSTI